MWKKTGKRLPAYTLAELMVVMLLSGILSVAIYGMYYWLLKRYNDYDQKRQHTEEVLQLSSELERLFFEANSIEAGRSNQLFFYLPGQEVLMQFEGEYVLRQLGFQLDTLHVAASLGGVREINIRGKQPLVQQVSVLMLYGQEEQERVFIKEYDAKSLLPASQIMSY